MHHNIWIITRCLTRNKSFAKYTYDSFNGVFGETQFMGVRLSRKHDSSYNNDLAVRARCSE